MDTKTEYKIEIEPSSTTDLPLMYEGFKHSAFEIFGADQSAKKFVQWLVSPDFPKITFTGFVNNEPAGVFVTSLHEHPFNVPSVQAVAELAYVKKKFRNSNVGAELYKATRDLLKKNNIPILFGGVKFDKDFFAGKLSKEYPSIKKVGSIYVDNLEE